MFCTYPLAATLQSDVPGSMRYAAIVGYDHSLGWINGLSSLKTVSLPLMQQPECQFLIMLVLGV